MSQSSSSKGQARLKSSLDAFIATLSSQERQLLVATSLGKPEASDVISFADEIHSLKSKHGAKKFATRLRPFLTSVQQFTAVMDTFAQGLPDASSLIWGGLKFLLLAAANFFDYFEKLSDMFMKLGVLCPVFVDFRHLFPDRVRLQGAASEFFAVVLDFCKEAFKFVKSGIQILGRKISEARTHIDKNLIATKQIAKALWKPFKVKFEGIETELSIRRDHLDEEIKLAAESAAHLERQEASLYRIEGKKYRTDAMIHFAKEEQWQIQLDIQRKVKRRKLLIARLSNLDYRVAFMRARRLRHEGTGKWILDNLAFKRWLDDDDPSILLSTGIPGSGKSILTSSVIDNLFEQYSRKGTSAARATISYFFCDFSVPSSLDCNRIFASIAQQLVNFLDPLPSNVESLLEDDGIPFADNKLRELLALSLSTLHNYTHFIAIDGLDECADDEVHRCISHLAQLIQECKSKGVLLKVLLSCRPEIDIVKRVEHIGCYRVVVGDENCRQDIEHYIAGEVHRLQEEQRLPRDDDLTRMINLELRKGAQGMFLWVNFQLQDITSRDTPEEIRDALSSLPKGLDETYSRILHRISQHRNPETAVKIFNWLAVSKRPLTMAELAEAVGLRWGDTSWSQRRVPFSNIDLVKHCGNLINFDAGACDTGDKPIRFVHSTVLKYFETRHAATDATKKFSIETTMANKIAAEICLTYLNFGEFRTQVARVDKPKPSFLDMEPTSWVPAMLGSNTWASYFYSLWEGRTSSPSKLVASPTNVHRVLKSEASSDSVTKANIPNSRYCLLPYVIAHWLHHCQGLTKKDRCYYLLKRFVYEDHLPFNILPWNLESTEGDGPDDVDPGTWRAFIWGINSCNVTLLELIADHCAPGSWGACQQYHSPEIDKYDEYKNPCPIGMSRAFQLNSRPVADFLYSRFPNHHLNSLRHFWCWSIRSQNTMGLDFFNRWLSDLQTHHVYNWVEIKRELSHYLQEAAILGNLGLMEHILEYGGDVNYYGDGKTVGLSGYFATRSSISRSPLLAACSNKDVPLETVRWLLERGADVHAKANSYMTPLAIAANFGRLDVVNLLLDYSAGPIAGTTPDGNTEYSTYSTRLALTRAAFRCHLSIVNRLLREPGMDVRVMEAHPEYETGILIKCPVMRGRFDVVERLIRAGAQIAPRPGDDNAIHIAKQSGHAKLARYLEWYDKLDEHGRDAPRKIQPKREGLQRAHSLSEY